jgi:hypothetical protein
MVQEAKMSSNCDKNIMKQSTTFIKKPIKSTIAFDRNIDDIKLLGCWLEQLIGGKTSELCMKPSPMEKYTLIP